MMHPVCIACDHTVEAFIVLTFVALERLLANFQPIMFHVSKEHLRHSSCTAFEIPAPQILPDDGPVLCQT